MFIGHFAVGFGAKKAAPNVSLGTMFISVAFLDLLWPVFLLLGIEHVRVVPGITAFNPLDLYDYPWSHSLAMAISWSILAGLVYLAARRNGRGALCVGAGVFSHWVLDFITHRPDMPAAPGYPGSMGLGLWNSVPGTVIVEGAMYLAGIVLYLRSTKARDRTGTYGFWALAIFLVVAYILSIISQPPPDQKALGYGGLSVWLIILWGYWVDRHREAGT